MYSGFYTAASGMLMNRRSLDVSANNMANQNTPGFRAKRVVGTAFETQLQRVQGQQKTEIGTGSPISVVSEVMTNFDEMNIKETGRPFDIAIEGEGFFTIQGENGQYLTRNGNFDMDEEGYLVLPGAGRVLGDRGPVQVRNSEFVIGKTGNIYGSYGNLLDQLQIVQPEGEANLTPLENGLYAGGQTQMVRVYPDTVQGFTEVSNVDLNDEMTHMMEIQRAFQSCSKALTIIDQMNQKTASEIGKL